MKTTNAIVTVHPDPIPSAHYPTDEQAANGAMDYRVTIEIPAMTSCHCETCGIDVDDAGDGCDCETPSGKIASVLVAARMIDGEITLYRDKVNGGMSPCGSPIDGWCSDSIVSFAHTLTDRTRRDLLASLAGGVGSESVEIEVA